MRTLRLGSSALVIACALSAAACSSGTISAPATTVGIAPTPHLTATQEAISWFNAINQKNVAASLSHFQADTRYMGEWNEDDVLAWPTFTHVRCRPYGHQSNQAVVYCSFKSHGDPSSANDTFWTVEFDQRPGGPWLITNYGQG
jgi:hypothetical protein